MLLVLLALVLTVLALVPLGTDAAAPAGMPVGAGLIQQGEKLTGAGEALGGHLGASAALSADGETLAVGAPDDNGFRGAVYVYSQSGPSTWTQTGVLTPGELTSAAGGGTCTPGACASEECAEELQENEATNECAFGSSVAVSADGDTVLVGDPSATAAPGAAWVYTREGSTWKRSAVLQGTAEPGEGRFGRSVALSADGATALIGDPSALGQRGGAFVFTREGSTWTRGESILTDEEASSLAHVGRSVALSADGAEALLGGPGDDSYTGAAWVFTRAGPTWRQQAGKLVGEGASAGTHEGKAVALSGDGATALIGAQNAEGNHGAVWAFTRGESGFDGHGTEIRAYKSGEAESEARFGASLALSGDGETALIGAPQAEVGVGFVAVLKRSGSTWTRRSEHLAGSGADRKSWTGVAVSLSADGLTAAVGATRDNKQTGAAWVFHEEVQQLPPVVTAVVPHHGPTAGGTPVLIRGEHFEGATEVHFGKTAVAVTAVNATEIMTTTPPGAVGKVDVTVTTPVGTSALLLRDSFTYEEEAASGSGESEGAGGAPKEHEAQHEEPPKGDGSTTTTSTKTTAPAGGVASFTATAADCHVSLVKKQLAVTRYSSVALRLVRTGTSACRGSVALSYKVKAKGRGYALRTIGTASFSISTQPSVLVTVKLSKAGQTWLRAHKGKVNASVSIARVFPAPTLAQTASVRLSIKKASKRATRG